MADFNGDIRSWNTSRVTTMAGMFQGATSFNNGKPSGHSSLSPAIDRLDADGKPNAIADWDISQVRDMSYMFAGAASFNQSLGKWNLPEATRRTAMFSGSPVAETVARLPRVGGKTKNQVAAPQSLEASAPTMDSVTLEWTAPLSLAGVDSKTIRYMLFVSTARPALAGRAVPVGSVHAYVAEGLQPETKYYFQVVASSPGLWDSSASPEATATTQKLPHYLLRFQEVAQDGTKEGAKLLHSQAVRHGEQATKPYSEKEGYTLYGWYEDEAYTKVFDFASPITKAQTLYARWIDTSGYQVRYSTTDNKNYWRNTSTNNTSNLTNQKVSLTPSGVEQVDGKDITHKLYYRKVDLTITVSSDKKISNAPAYPHLRSSSETGVKAYADAITLEKPASRREADAPKAKVYGLASRIFIKDAHGDWAAAGKMQAEYYFLNDQKGPKKIELKTTHNSSTTVSGLFMRQGGNLRLRVLEEGTLTNNP
ncbi:MAG: BspA family leucine-rich repeat surface protein, partial [Spirochaetota bacterium]